MTYGTRRGIFQFKRQWYDILSLKRDARLGISVPIKKRTVPGGEKKGKSQWVKGAVKHAKREKKEGITVGKGIQKKSH